MVFVDRNRPWNIVEDHTGPAHFLKANTLAGLIEIFYKQISMLIEFAAKEAHKSHMGHMENQ